MYKISKNVLKSNKYIISLKKKNNHIWVSIIKKGDYKKQGITSIKDKLSSFELKSVVLHIFRESIKHNKNIDLKHMNYAEVFGSYFE